MTARARVTKVRILEPSAFGDGPGRSPRPRAGQRTTFRLSKATGVLTIGLLGVTYCNAATTDDRRCGA